ncbi:MAG: hypothetical protein ACJ76J_27995 [Thermoanaerobaculia bacterium]
MPTVESRAFDHILGGAMSGSMLVRGLRMVPKDQPGRSDGP